VAVSVSARKGTYAQKPIFDTAVEVLATVPSVVPESSLREILVAVLSIAPESSITCVSSASAQKETYIQKPGFEAVVGIEPAVEVSRPLSKCRGCYRSVEARRRGVRGCCRGMRPLSRYRGRCRIVKAAVKV
jgi:hypothetical protein